MALTDRVVSIFDWARRVAIPPDTPEPPPFNKDVPGAYAIFMDEDEKTVLYAKPWPYLGIPNDDRTNSIIWNIDGQYYGPSHRDAKGNWIFRRCAG